MYDAKKEDYSENIKLQPYNDIIHLNKYIEEVCPIYHDLLFSLSSRLSSENK